MTAQGPDPRFFDLWSHFYDVPWVQRLTYRPVHDAVLGELRARRPARILDVGCGTGLLAARLGRELPRSVVVGCDFSRGMLRRAARHRRLRCVQGDALRLPLRDQSFDALVCTEAFHWFPDPEAALGEFRRVLAPRGRLLLALVNPPFAVLGAAARAGSRLLGEPLRWPTRARLRAQVEAAGFRVEAQTRVLRLVAPLAFPTFLTAASRSD
jgi:ubiquinone/menaquinone biosynthesis C-methylase UbiE